MPPIIAISGISRGVGPKAQPGIPPNPGAIVPPNRWYFCGDSQTAGRAFDTTSALNHRVAFTNIWNENGFTSPTTNITNGGQSGRTLAGTLTFIDGLTITGTPWFHIQESGQQQTGETTAAEFAQTLYDGIVALNTEYSGAFFTYETAFSFGREGESQRNWGPYNDELPGVVADLAAVGITLYVVPVCEVIELLETQIAPSDVWYQAGHAQAYHYTGIGNFAIAMAIYQTLNYDIEELLHGSVVLDEDDKQAAIDAVLAVAA